MPVDPKVQIGAQLAITLASLYLPGSGQAVSALSAIFDAVTAFNAANNRPAGYVPSAEELDTFIADREAKRILVHTPAPPETGSGRDA